MIDIHDNEVIGYSVDFINNKIVLKTKDSMSNNVVDVIFFNVFAHYFINAIKGSILFEICDKGINEFIRVNKEELEKGKPYFWPMYYKDISEFISKITEENYRCYNISSSDGISGWIISKNIEYKFIKDVN